jgi:putative ATP-dependent endonuclease of OLD family
MLITNADGYKYMPIIIALDEPEIHQHPYRQRALIKGIKNIIDNKNQEFIELIKELFGIDGLTGQVFVVTHSPSILLNDYRQLIRFYKVNKEVNVKCGQKINFDDKTRKHLLRSFIYIKEAMFSKFIILVEGDTEYGALPVFIKRMGYDLDEKCIGIIKLDGADSVIRCMKLYNEYNIHVIAIIDKDKEEDYKGGEGIVFTNEKDFEAEVYNSFKIFDYMSYQKSIGKLGHFIKPLKEAVIDLKPKAFLEDHRKYLIPEEWQKKIMVDNKEREIEELRKNKNALNGALVAEYVTNIPNIFVSTIQSVINGVDANE